MSAIYVIGVPRLGGVWLSDERYYIDYDQASKVLDDLWARDEAFAKRNDIPVTHTVKLFTLYAEPEVLCSKTNTLP